MGLIALVLLVLVFASASVQDESLAAKNKEDIVKHEEILKEKVAADLQELKTKFKELVTTVNSKLTELRDYTKDAIEKLQEDTTAHMNAGDTTIKENIRNKVNEVNEKMVENLKALSKASAKQRKDIRDWNNERSRKHEEILGTHVSLCDYDYGDYAKGKNHVVTYNSARGGYLDGHKSWQVRHLRHAPRLQHNFSQTGRIRRSSSQAIEGDGYSRLPCLLLWLLDSPGKGHRVSRR